MCGILELYQNHFESFTKRPHLQKSRKNTAVDRRLSPFQLFPRSSGQGLPNRNGSKSPIYNPKTPTSKKKKFNVRNLWNPTKLSEYSVNQNQKFSFYIKILFKTTKKQLLHKCIPLKKPPIIQIVAKFGSKMSVNVFFLDRNRTPPEEKSEAILFYGTSYSDDETTNRSGN